MLQSFLSVAGGLLIWNPLSLAGASCADCDKHPLNLPEMSSNHLDGLKQFFALSVSPENNFYDIDTLLDLKILNEKKKVDNSSSDYFRKLVSKEINLLLH